MSLFKILQWFNYQCPDIDQNYDSFSLTCARLTVDSEQNTDNIIVTSHSGYISILQPSAAANDNDVEQHLDQAPHHSSILYEAKLNEPILGVLCGNFVPYSQRQERQNNNNIAILHPQTLVIYSLITSEHGQQSKLHVLLKHDLQKMAFSFCKGNFGGVKIKEFICVMYLDGSLKFFEQDGISQNCLLPGSRTIPTKLIYCQRTDCFILLAPNWDLECYRYLNLSESFERKFSPIWSLNVGEYILDLNSHQISNTESLIVLLGENNLICVSDTGKMRFIKKLDYTPLSFCSFTVGWYFEPDCKLMIAVTTENGSLLIYQESTLVWCAELLDQPIAIQRGNFAGLAGGLVTLTLMGKVTVGYLGSNLSVYKVPPMNLSKLDYEKSKTELEEMEKEINSSVDNSDVQFINASAEKDLQIKSRLEFQDINGDEFARLHIKLVSSVNLEQVQLFLTPNPAFILKENIIFLKNLKAYDEHFVEVTVYPNKSQNSELCFGEFTVMISFTNKQSIIRMIKHIVDIPLTNILKKDNPQKDGLFKVTLSIVNPIDFAAMFEGFDIFETSQASGLKTFNSDHIVTIISAKSSNRFRIQSSSLAALAFFMNTLSKFIASTYSSDGKVTQFVSIKTIPSTTIELFLTTIEKYHNLKSEIKSTIEALNAKTGEMRLFERFYLMKMQEKTPSTSIDSINMLLYETSKEISFLNNQYRALRAQVERAQVQVASTICFLRKMIEYTEIPQPKIKENLLYITRPFVADFQVQSWVEAVAPYVDYLYNMRQTTSNENQPYENFSFNNDNFSVTRLNKQLKNIFSVVTENSAQNNLLSAEKVLVEEQTDNENEWN